MHKLLKVKICISESAIQVKMTRSDAWDSGGH